MGLRVLVIGRIPEKLRPDLAALEPVAEWLILADAGGSADYPEARPDLVFLGEDIGSTRVPPARRADGAACEPPPVIALSRAAEADFWLPDEEPGRGQVLRAACLLARARRELEHRAWGDPSHRTGSTRGDHPSGPFFGRLEYEFSRAHRYRHPVSLLTLSLDGRERLTSIYGAASLSQFMLVLTETLRRCLRDVDLLFRPMEDELAAILPETPASGAIVVGDRFLSQASRLVVKPTAEGARPMLPLKTTPSIGIAEGPRQGIATAMDLLSRSRQARECARASGGARVVVHGAETARPRLASSR